MAETRGDLLTSMGFDTALNMYDLEACVVRLADRVVRLTQERDALLADKVRMRALESVLANVTDVWLTFGNPEHGTECTLARNDEDVHVSNQLSGFDAVLSAYAKFDAARTAEAPTDG